jgi:hypothetical protein
MIYDCVIALATIDSLIDLFSHLELILDSLKNSEHVSMCPMYSTHVVVKNSMDFYACQT